jgi:hypothetical protein
MLFRSLGFGVSIRVRGVGSTVDDLGVAPGRGGECPSYDELAVVVVGLTARLDELSVRVGGLEAANARLVADNTAPREGNAGAVSPARPPRNRRFRQRRTGRSAAPAGLPRPCRPPEPL